MPRRSYRNYKLCIALHRASLLAIAVVLRVAERKKKRERKENPFLSDFYFFRFQNMAPAPLPGPPSAREGDAGRVACHPSIGTRIQNSVPVCSPSGGFLRAFRRTLAGRRLMDGFPRGGAVLLNRVGPQIGFVFDCRRLAALQVLHDDGTDRVLFGASVFAFH